MYPYFVGLKPYLPSRWYCFLRGVYWQRYWAKELALQRGELGEKAASSFIGSERAVLAEALVEALPFSSLLEVGCSYGQLFYVIAPLCPRVKFVGVDPNEERILAGRFQLNKSNFNNVELGLGQAEDLSAFDDRSFDILVTSASLLYVSPDNFAQALAEFKRVTTKGMFFLEQHTDSLVGKESQRFIDPASGESYWLRNYRKSLEGFFSQEAISIQRVPHPLWETESWQNYAHLIHVDLTLKLS